jgi:2-keto-4-pentenoate hydratase
MRKLIHNILIYMIYCSFLSFCMPLAHALEPRPFVAELVNARQNHALTPNLSQLSELGMSDAYAIQVGFVKEQLKNDVIAGFKAGLTSQQAQASLGINRPIFGVLMQSGDYSKAPTLLLSRFHKLTLETELGFVTNQPIRKMVHSVEELKHYIGRVVPVVELPDLGFKEANFNAIDLVACNTGFAAYIIDPNVNWIDQDINSLSVTLYREGQIVNQGQGIDALGDQWEALRWLVNQVVAHGWAVGKGHIFITGALGEIIPASPGSYRAQFNNEATIEFTIQSS